MTVAARAKLPGLDARRADTIYAGAVVFRTALELAGAERGGAVRDGAARGDHRRLRRLQPPGDPAGRGVSRPAAAERDGAGAPLPVPRGPRHARGAAGALDLSSDAAAAQAGRRRRRAARVRGAPARHRLLHLAAPPPPPQRVPDQEPRHDRLFALGGGDHRAHRAPPPQGRAAPRARRHQDDLQGRRAPRALPGGDPAGGRRARSHARPPGARGALLDLLTHRRGPRRRRRRSRARALGRAAQGRSLRGARRAQAPLRRRRPQGARGAPGGRRASARPPPRGPRPQPSNERAARRPARAGRSRARPR